MRLKDYISSVKNKKVTVIGIGVSNTPLIRMLLENGVRVTACDKSEREKLGGVAEELESLGAELHLGEKYLDNIEADIVFRTPGMHPDTPQLAAARDKGAEITSEMEVFFRVCPCKIIAVTGSDGKTTTTSIIAEMLRRANYRVHVGGNIGTPLLCIADTIYPTDIVVLELSSFQLMTMNCSPEIAVVTNLAPNHLDMHKNMEEYVNAKKNIFLHQNANDKLILNLDNEITRGFADEARGKVIYFSRKEPVKDGCFVHDELIISAKNGIKRIIMKKSDIFLPGEHNVENYMAAFAATEELVSSEIQRETAMYFRGVEHRIEYVRTLRGVKYYNDSIASSPSRTTAGLLSFKQKVILIAGGKDKGVPFDPLGPVIMEHVKKLVLTGFAADKIRAAVENAPGYSGEPSITTIEDFKDAVIEASRLAENSDIVILSPACTSFDHFKNFAERGRIFKEIINGLE